MLNLHESIDFYKVLNVDAAANAADIRKSFYTAALRTHPDKGGSNAAFHAVTAAFEVLSCPARRALYDQWLSQCRRSAHGNIPCTTTMKAHCGSKRSSFHVDGNQPPVKRKRSTYQQSTRGRNSVKTSRLDTTLGSVRSILQMMSHCERQAAILVMPSKVRLALLSHMEHPRRNGGVSCNVKADTQPTLLKQQLHETKMNTITLNASSYGISKVYKNLDSERTRYQANIHIKALRLYTREQSTLESALEHQIVLVQIKQALTARSSRDSQFWDKPKQVLQECEAVLHANGTTEALLGLRAWVHMRASNWISYKHRIGSMASSLATVVELHAQLLRARATSWECFRSEWVKLMQARKRVSLREAEAIADTCRHKFLEEHLARAITGVQRILNQTGSKGNGTKHATRDNVSKNADSGSMPCTGHVDFSE